MRIEAIVFLNGGIYYNYIYNLKLSIIISEFRSDSAGIRGGKEGKSASDRELERSPLRGLSVNAGAGESERG